MLYYIKLLAWGHVLGMHVLNAYNSLIPTFYECVISASVWLIPREALYKCMQYNTTYYLTQLHRGELQGYNLAQQMTLRIFSSILTTLLFLSSGNIGLNLVCLRCRLRVLHWIRVSVKHLTFLLVLYMEYFAEMVLHRLFI